VTSSTTGSKINANNAEIMSVTKKSRPKYSKATVAAKAISEVAILTLFAELCGGISSSKAILHFTFYNSDLNNATDYPQIGRVLALDVGKKRIGLALSDELGLTAQGIETLQRTRIREDLEKLKDLASRSNVKVLLIGKPLHMSGDESRQSEYTREFAARLAAHLQLPVVFWDERLTSVEAGRILRAGGASLEQHKKSVDRLSAVLLLESYLAYRDNEADQDNQSNE